MGIRHVGEGGLVVSPVDEFLDGVTLDDANGWHPRIARKRARLTGSLVRYPRHKANKRKPDDDAWADDDGRDTPPRWADV